MTGRRNWQTLKTYGILLHQTLLVSFRTSWRSLCDHTCRSVLPFWWLLRVPFYGSTTFTNSFSEHSGCAYIFASWYICGINSKQWNFQAKRNTFEIVIDFFEKIFTRSCSTQTVQCLVASDSSLTSLNHWVRISNISWIIKSHETPPRIIWLFWK